MQRTPPDTLKKQLTPPINTTHYNSDSALNTSKEVLDDSYFNITKRQKRTFGEINQHATSMSEIRSLFSEIQSQQDKKFEKLNNALITIMAQNQEIQTSITLLNKHHEELRLEITDLKEENKELKNRITTLEKKLNIQESNTCSSMVEIRNIPKSENQDKKDLIKIIQIIGSTLGLAQEIQECEIRNVFRTKSEAVVVDFVSVVRKQSLLIQYKKYNKIRREKGETLLQTEHLHLPGPTKQIYLSEYLIMKTRHLFFLARNNVKNKNLYAAWTFKGKIYVKKEQSSIPLRIDEEADLNQVLL